MLEGRFWVSPVKLPHYQYQSLVTVSHSPSVAEWLSDWLTDCDSPSTHSLSVVRHSFTEDDPVSERQVVTNYVRGNLFNWTNLLVIAQSVTSDLVSQSVDWVSDWVNGVVKKNKIKQTVFQIKSSDIPILIALTDRHVMDSGIPFKFKHLLRSASLTCALCLNFRVRTCFFINMYIAFLL